MRPQLCTGLESTERCVQAPRTGLSEPFQCHTKLKNTHFSRLVGLLREVLTLREFISVVFSVHGALLQCEPKTFRGSNNIVPHDERSGLKLSARNLHICQRGRYRVCIAVKEGQWNCERASHYLVFIVELIHSTKGNIRYPVRSCEVEFCFQGCHFQTRGLLIGPMLRGAGREFLS